MAWSFWTWRFPLCWMICRQIDLAEPGVWAQNGVCLLCGENHCQGSRCRSYHSPLGVGVCAQRTISKQQKKPTLPNSMVWPSSAETGLKTAPWTKPWNRTLELEAHLPWPTGREGEARPLSMYILLSHKMWDAGLSPPSGCIEDHRKFGLTSLVLEDSNFMKRENFPSLLNYNAWTWKFIWHMAG